MQCSLPAFTQMGLLKSRGHLSSKPKSMKATLALTTEEQDHSSSQNCKLLIVSQKWLTPWQNYSLLLSRLQYLLSLQPWTLSSLNMGPLWGQNMQRGGDVGPNSAPSQEGCSGEEEHKPRLGANIYYLLILNDRMKSGGENFNFHGFKRKVTMTALCQDFNLLWPLQER